MVAVEVGEQGVRAVQVRRGLSRCRVPAGGLGCGGLSADDEDALDGPVGRVTVGQRAIELAQRIHDTPELAFKEAKAAAWLTDFLEKHGAKVERGVGGLPTAFRATVEGTGAGPTY